MTEPIYHKYVDYGGMFDGTLTIHEDSVEGCDKPFLASARSGFGSVRGRKEDAMQDLPRLSKAEFGY